MAVKMSKKPRPLTARDRADLARIAPKLPAELAEQLLPFARPSLKAGRPKEWTAGNLISIWAAIELRTDRPRLGVAYACKMLAADPDAMSNRSLPAERHIPKARRLSLSERTSMALSAATLENAHAEGEALIRQDPKVAAHAKLLLETARSLMKEMVGANVLPARFMPAKAKKSAPRR